MSKCGHVFPELARTHCAECADTPAPADESHSILDKSSDRQSSQNTMTPGGVEDARERAWKLCGVEMLKRTNATLSDIGDYMFDAGYAAAQARAIEDRHAMAKGLDHMADKLARAEAVIAEMERALVHCVKEHAIVPEEQAEQALAAIAKYRGEK